MCPRVASRKPSTCRSASTSIAPAVSRRVAEVSIVMVV
jgi:hypothetical protein